MRPLIALSSLALLAAGACTAGDPAPDVIPPPAAAPAPSRLTQADVVDPPTPAPTAQGKSESMTPPFMQHTPPRPHTRTATPRSDSTTVVTPALPAT